MRVKPINYAVLKYMTTVEKACPADVIEALKGEYGSHRMLTEKGVLEMLMSAEANGLLAEDHYELDGNGELVIYYNCIDPDTINSYIK